MDVAPHEACIGCYPGDTTTAFGIRGEPEYIVAGLHKRAGISFDDAKDSLNVKVIESGDLPKQIVVRLCRDCARKTGTKVAEISSGEVPLYGQR